MRQYNFFCTFEDHEKGLTWTEHLKNLSKILKKIDGLNPLFGTWGNTPLFPNGFAERLGDMSDENALKFYQEYEARTPVRFLSDLSKLAEQLEKEMPIQETGSASILLSNSYRRMNDDQTKYVGVSYSSDNRLPNGWGSQCFEISFGHIFKTIEDYVRFMASACEIMCTEKKQIERIVFAPDHYTGKRVFSHRQAGGWMVFYPSKLNPKDFPSASRVINVKDHGTLIVATDEIFDMDNPAHIDKANQVEIRLAELGLLKPLPEMP